jgi:hypothetical protein
MARRRISSSAMVPYGSSMWMSHGGSAMITLASARGMGGRRRSAGMKEWSMRACKRVPELAEHRQVDVPHVALDPLPL